MALLLIFSAISFLMLLGSIFPNRRHRTHFPPNSYTQDTSYYYPPQPNTYLPQPNPFYQQPFSPHYQNGENNPSAFLYTLIFMALVMGFLYLSA